VGNQPQRPDVSRLPYPNATIILHLGEVDTHFSKISIAALIGAFASALETALGDRTGARKLAYYASWTVTAATLIELWSRLLAPADAPAARAAADWLDRRVQLGRDVFRRGQPEIGPADRGGDLTDLLRACLPALQVLDAQAAALQSRPPPLWTASNALAHLAHLLAVLPDGSPLAAYLPTIPEDVPRRALRHRAGVASTLIAVLERARDGALSLDQESAWRPIRITRRDDNPPADATETPA
jgi:segregation and condensation protein A